MHATGRAVMRDIYIEREGERERERENKTTVQTCPGLKQVLIQIFALQDSLFKAWFANVVPMAATIYLFLYISFPPRDFILHLILLRWHSDGHSMWLLHRESVTFYLDDTQRVTKPEDNCSDMTL